MLVVEELNVAYNVLLGISSCIRTLPELQNFTALFNFFIGEAANSFALPSREVLFDDRVDCLPGRPHQYMASNCSLYTN